MVVAFTFKDGRLESVLHTVDPVGRAIRRRSSIHSLSSLSSDKKNFSKSSCAATILNFNSDKTAINNKAKMPAILVVLYHVINIRRQTPLAILGLQKNSQPISNDKKFSTDKKISLPTKKFSTDE